MTGRLDRWLPGLTAGLAAGLAVTAWFLVQQIEALDRRVALLEARPQAMQTAAAPAAPAPAPAGGRGETPADLEGQVSRIVARLDGLDESIVALRGELRQAAWSGQASGAPVEEPPLPATPEPRLSAWEEADRRYWEEPVDPAWQREMQARITQSIGDVPGAEHVQLDAVECRSQRCLVSWRFDEGLSGAEYFELENYFMAALAQAGLNAATTRSDGTALEAYFFHQADQPPAGGEDN